MTEPNTAVGVRGMKPSHPHDPVSTCTATALRTRFPVPRKPHEEIDMVHSGLPDDQGLLLEVLRAVRGHSLPATALDALGMSGEHVDDELGVLVRRGLARQFPDPLGELRFQAIQEQPAQSHPPEGHGAGADTGVAGHAARTPAVTEALTTLVDYYTLRLNSLAEMLEPGKHAYSPLRSHAPVLRDRAEARAAFDQERATAPNVLTIAVELGLHDQAWQLAEALWPLLRSDGHAEAVLDTQTLGARAAHAVGHVYESTALSRCAWALTRLGRATEAIDHARNAHRLAVEHVDDLAQATALSMSARAFGVDGRFEEALRTGFEALGVDWRRNTARWVIGLRLRELAGFYQALGRLDHARRAARLAVRLIESNPVPRPAEHARALTVLATIHLDLRQAAEAEQALLRAGTLLDPLTDRLYLAEVNELRFRMAGVLGGDGEPYRKLAVAGFLAAGHRGRAEALRPASSPARENP